MGSVKHRHHYSDENGRTRVADCKPDDVSSRFEFRGALDILIRDMPIAWLVRHEVAIALFAALYDPTAIALT